MRDVAIYENPIMEPGVCARCYSQDKDWFVDLGLNIAGTKTSPMNQGQENAEYSYPNHWFDGAIIYCCDCINNLMSDVERRFKQFKETHSPEVEFNGRTNQNFNRGNTEPDGDDPSPESPINFPFSLSNTA